MHVYFREYSNVENSSKLKRNLNVVTVPQDS